MTIPTITQVISPMPDPPVRDIDVDPLVFVAKAEATNAAQVTNAEEMEEFRQQANAMADGFNGVIAQQTPLTKTTTYTALNGDIIHASTAGGPWTLTLPSGGGTVTVRDTARTWATNALTIAGNGKTIDGLTTLNASQFAEYEIVFTSVGSVWTYRLSYLYGA